MALNAFMRLKGATQGQIRGCETRAGREDSIMVIAFDHQVLSQLDSSSNNATGRPQHKALTITKEIDKTSPLLMKALVNNELIVEFELRFWQPSATGKEVQFYTIQLVKASIVSIRQEMLNNRHPENVQHREREHVSFCYGKIIWTFEDGGITSESDWEERIP